MVWVSLISSLLFQSNVPSLNAQCDGIDYLSCNSGEFSCNYDPAGIPLDFIYDFPTPIVQVNIKAQSSMPPAVLDPKIQFTIDPLISGTSLVEDGIAKLFDITQGFSLLVECPTCDPASDPMPYVFTLNITCFDNSITNEISSTSNPVSTLTGAPTNTVQPSTSPTTGSYFSPCISFIYPGTLVRNKFPTTLFRHTHHDSLTNHSNSLAKLR